MKKKYTPENISTLGPNEIFVFGSNLKGHHAGGAARVARNLFGAVMGRGVGLQGQSYAIPTMQGGVETIEPYINEFIEFAKTHPELTFYVTRIGCGIAGFKDSEIAPLFDAAFDMDNVILPETFAYIINHARCLASETAGMVFHLVSKPFFPKDMIKAASYPPVLNCTPSGSHIIAITEKAYAIAVGTKLYSNLYLWGLEMSAPILSVVAQDGCSPTYLYGQFVVLLEDGTIRQVWSESCIKKLSSDEERFTAVASGCGGAVFGLRSDGTVAVLVEGDIPLYEVREWTHIKQIDAGPRHIVGLRNDGTVVAAGKPSACAHLDAWYDIEKIYVSKTAPLFGKVNDLTFGIDSKGWLHVEGDLWSKGEQFWKKIRAQYDVCDVIENGYAVWVRLQDGSIRCVMYYGQMNYLDELNFVRKYEKGLCYMDAYGSHMIIIDSEGEFRILDTNTSKEISWI